MKNKEKPLAVITVIIIIAAVVYAVIVRPQLRERKHRLERMHLLELQLTKIRADMLIKDRIDRIYSQIEPLIAESGGDQQEISLLARELSSLYSKLDVKIRSVKILPVTNEQFYRRLAVKVELCGHISNILKFIFAVEHHPNPLRVEQLSLKTQEIIDNIQASLVITKVVAASEQQSG